MKLISEVQLEEFEDKSNIRLREAVRAIVLRNGKIYFSTEDKIIITKLLGNIHFLLTEL